MLFHPIQFLHNISVKLWEDICTVNLKSNQVSGPTVPVLFSSIQNGWTGVIAVFRTSDLALLMCDVLSCALCDIWPLRSSVVNRLSTNPFMHSSLSHMVTSARCALSPACHFLFGHLYCSSWGAKADLKFVINYSNFTSWKTKTCDAAWLVEHSEKRPHVHTALNKLCAHLRKYNTPKWSAMIAVRDRLKLLERNQKASDCYISDLWSNTSREQLQLSAHIPVWLLFLQSGRNISFKRLKGLK